MRSVMVRTTLALLALVLCTAAFPLQSRDATSPCSLAGSKAEDPFEAACQLNSTAGMGPGRRLRLHFGEQDCVVKLTHCIPNNCYVMLDTTSIIPTDAVDPAASLSFFSSFRAMSGATLEWTREGIVFRPTASVVYLAYSTQTCRQFYSLRGRVTPQLCGEPQDVLSTIVAGLPLLSCKADER